VKRVPNDELLDSDAGTPAEIAGSFADLHLVNRCFGGNATSRTMIERVASELGKRSLSLLEVAAGSGDVPRAVQKSLSRRGIQLEVTLLDRAASHLAAGDQGDGMRTVVGDALALPFHDESFDLVACNLFAHHLSPAQLPLFVNEGLRVCRTAVLINDLVRDGWHLASVYAALPFFRSRVTRHDALASVRQAYTPAEMRKLLATTKAARIEIDRHYFFRMAAVIWKRTSA
jgi:ubiquinone/menaquinone biosynthesis C-methylase UbiE